MTRNSSRQARPKYGVREIVVLLAILGAIALYKHYTGQPFLDDPRDRNVAIDDTKGRESSTQTAETLTVDGSAQLEQGEQQILDAFEAQQSDIIVQASGRVRKLLPDDTIEPRHQKLIVELSSGHTVQIAHNIDLADRVPVREGETIEFRGEY
ncbi:MAG: DUF3465 domain-containing protein, partial [Planctomycetales bacterium]|nr:DUF3465 domain-containing protein [Planctomycetales bacterium]